MDLYLLNGILQFVSRFLRILVKFLINSSSNAENLILSKYSEISDGDRANIYSQSIVL